jgi:amidase
MPTWQEIAAEKKARQTASIPKEWLITPPPDDVLDVTDVPAKCGLLSARDLQITTVTDATILLQKLATGEWSSVEVTTAFCKRAVIAHQVVRPSFHCQLVGGHIQTCSVSFFPDKLPYRDLR